jgi:hypothetical protein
VAGALTFERELPLAAPADAAWAALATLEPARGSAAGYAGSVSVLDLDDDERVATLRLLGAAGASTVAVTASVAVREAALDVSADVAFGPGGQPVDEETAREALGHLATTLAFALATAARPRRVWDAAVPPTPSPSFAWDAPSPPPTQPLREPIDETATLAPAEPRVEPAPVARRGVPELAPPVVEGGVLTPRRRDVVTPGEEPVGGWDERRLIRVGIAAAAGLAALRILRGRR